MAKAATKKNAPKSSVKPGSVADLTGRSDDELSSQLGELKRESFNLRFQAATNQLEKPARVRQVRRTIARIKTLQGQRVSAAAAK